MNDLMTTEQTMAAVRGLIFFGLKNASQEILFDNGSAQIDAQTEIISAYHAGSNLPIDEQVKAIFHCARQNGRLLPGRITVNAMVRWAYPEERSLQGSPNYHLIRRPRMIPVGVNSVFMKNFSNLINCHAKALRDFIELNTA